MKEKYRKTLIYCGVATLILMISTSAVIGVLPLDKELPRAAFEIQFPLEADVTISDTTMKTYDVEALQAKLQGNVSYIYTNPQKTDYKIVSQLGFNTKDFSTSESFPDMRWYEAGAGENRRTLDIDKYGCFYYKSNAEDTWFAYPYTDEQTVQIAKDFLNRYGLWDDSFVTVSIDDTVNQTAEATTVIARTVHFYQKIDGKDVSGNQRIGIEINGNGEITLVNYNVRKYQSKQVANLVSVEEAIQKIAPGKAYVNIDSLSAQLIFESVVVNYWAQNLDYEHLALQPVYIFTGTSVNALEEKEDFTIAVQANIVK